MRLFVSNGFFCAKAPLRPGFAKKTAFLSAKAQKLQNSAFAEFWDSMPVLALECFSAYGTSVLGLWLGAFGKLGLFRCQSGIRGLWLEAFGKLGLFRCQSAFAAVI